MFICWCGWYGNCGSIDDVIDDVIVIVRLNIDGVVVIENF